MSSLGRTRVCSTTLTAAFTPKVLESMYKPYSLTPALIYADSCIGFDSQLWNFSAHLRGYAPCRIIDYPLDWDSSDFHASPGWDFVESSERFSSRTPRCPIWYSVDGHRHASKSPSYAILPALSVPGRVGWVGYGHSLHVGSFGAIVLLQGERVCGSRNCGN